MPASHLGTLSVKMRGALVGLLLEDWQTTGVFSVQYVRDERRIGRARVDLAINGFEAGFSFLGQVGEIYPVYIPELGLAHFAVRRRAGEAKAENLNVLWFGLNVLWFGIGCMRLLVNTLNACIALGTLAVKMRGALVGLLLKDWQTTGVFSVQYVRDERRIGRARVDHAGQWFRGRIVVLGAGW